MGAMYQVFVKSSMKEVEKELNKRRLGKVHIVYDIDGERLELSRRSRLKSWEEKIAYSIPGIVNTIEV